MKMAIVGVCALAGCASSKTVPLPNGSSGYFVRCVTEDSCLAEAAKLCGTYEIVSRRTVLSEAYFDYEWMIRCTD